MRRKLFLVQLVVILSVHRSQPAAAAAYAPLSPDLMSRWCEDASLQDFFETSEACHKAEALGSGDDCWASLDAVLQLCLEKAAAAGDLQSYSSADKLDLLKRNRNKFLGKRNIWKRGGGVRNNFLGKRQAIERLRNRMNAFLGEQLAAESGEKRNRNKFLGKRTENDGFEFDPTSPDKKSRNKFLGKRSQLEDLTKRARMIVSGNGLDDKRNRNSFLGKRDQTNMKRSRNKFLGK